MEELIEHITGIINKIKINCIVNNEEKYITFTTSKIKLNKLKKELEKISNKKYILRSLDNKHTINFVV